MYNKFYIVMFHRVFSYILTSNVTLSTTSKWNDDIELQWPVNSPSKVLIEEELLVESLILYPGTSTLGGQEGQLLPLPSSMRGRKGNNCPSY